MIMKQLKLHIKFHYKAILIFWIVALLVKNTLSISSLNRINVDFLQDILNNTSMIISFFIIVSTFTIQGDEFRLVVSFGVTRLQFLIGSICYFILQAAVFALLQVIFLQNVFYNVGNISINWYTIEKIFVQFLFYITLASLFQLILVSKQRFQWIGLAVGGTVFLGLTSAFYGEVGLSGLGFKIEGELVNVPYFLIISISLTAMYFVISSIMVRKISFEDTI